MAVSLVLLILSLPKFLLHFAFRVMMGMVTGAMMTTAGFDPMASTPVVRVPVLVLAPMLPPAAATLVVVCFLICRLLLLLLLCRRLVLGGWRQVSGRGATA